MSSFKSIAALCAMLGASAGWCAAQATVQVEPAHLDGPRPLAEQTAKAAIRDYLRSWQSMSAAFNGNSTALLDADFVGDAKDKLAATIQKQALLGLHARYQDRVHDIQIVFYSPEGLSIELTDNVDYDVELFDHDKSQTTQRVHARYLVVMTPAEVRWRVRVLQAEVE